MKAKLPNAPSAPASSTRWASASVLSWSPTLTGRSPSLITPRSGTSATVMISGSPSGSTGGVMLSGIAGIVRMPVAAITGGWLERSTVIGSRPMVVPPWSSRSRKANDPASPTAPRVGL